VAVGFIVGELCIRSLTVPSAMRLKVRCEMCRRALLLLKDALRFIRAVTWSGWGTPEGRRAWCKEAEFEADLQGVDVDVIEPLCGIFK